MGIGCGMSNARFGDFQELNGVVGGVTGSGLGFRGSRFGIVMRH